MSNEDWQEIVESLVNAKRQLANAWSILDGTDGSADGVEQVLHAALSAIDAVYAIESEHGANEDVATPVAIVEFWEKHDALPGFALGS